MKKIFMMAALLNWALGMDAQQVTFYTPSIVRITSTADGLPATRNSEVVIAKPNGVKVKTKKTGSAVSYVSSELTVTVDDGLVTFARPDGQVLVSVGEPQFTPIASGPDKGRFKVAATYKIAADEPVYGFGFMQNAKLNQRDEHRLMVQSNMEDYSHFFQSIKGYGIYWDNYSPTSLDGDSAGLRLESQVGDMADYYFLYGGDADGVISCMRQLTGHVPMVPLWTYGFHQSREYYESSQQLLEVVHRYRQSGVPFDGIVQDWKYWGSNYTWNAMDFLDDKFLDYKDMIADVHRNKAHLMTTIWSSFGPMTKQYKELAAKGWMFDFETWPESGLNQWPPRKDYPSGVRVYDAYSNGARDIYWKYLSHLRDMGVDGWWMDSTEPDATLKSDSDLDLQTTMGSWRSVRNLYPYECVKGVYEHQRAVEDSQRVFIYTRSNFAGQQRFGANMWSGDVSSSWQTLRAQVPGCLNFTLTGNPNVNTDIGGFFANAYNKTYLDQTATKNPQYQELYVRWMQFGLFCPMMRSHGTEVYREIYHYGEPGTPVYDALRAAIGMRYELLPYIYSTAWQVSKNDESFMRALLMDFKDDKRTWDDNKEFMFGRSFLVCPVVDPLYTTEKIVKTDEVTGWDRADNSSVEADDTTRLVNGWPACDWGQNKTYDAYLPKGAKWYDYWTGKCYEGGQTLRADAPLAHSPLFVKAGSIVPMAKECQNTADRDWSDLTLRVYPGADASFDLYEDEGDGYNYEKGEYTEIPIIWNNHSRSLTIGKRKGAFKGMLTRRTFRIVLPEGKTKTVEYAGKSMTVKL
jgi:alpha-D-xyloside xylohydrolase